MKKFGRLFFFILTLMNCLDGESVLAKSITKPEIRVAVGTNGLPIFSDKTAVQGLETAMAAVFGQLLYVNQATDVSPGLISKFNWDFKNKWYVLELSHGIKFHNGREATAKDLEFSLLRGLVSKQGAWAKSFFANIEGIKAAESAASIKSGMVSGIEPMDRYRLKIKLAAPNPSFLHALARSYFSLVPKEELKPDLVTWKKNPVGTGPYRVSRVNSSKSEVHLLKIVSEGGAPQKIVLSSETGFKNPDISLTTSGEGLDPVVLDSVSSATGIYFNYQNELGSNLEFRSAIAMTVQRTELVTGINIYTPSSELLPKKFWGRCDCKEKSSADTAKRVFSRLAGIGGEIEVPVFNSAFGESELGRYVEVLRTQFLAAGLKVKFVEGHKKFFDESDKNIPFRIISLGADVEDPLVLFGLFRKGSPMTPHYPTSDHKFESLYQEAANAISLESKAQAVKNLSQYFAAQNIAIPLFERNRASGSIIELLNLLGLRTGATPFT